MLLSLCIIFSIVTVSFNQPACSYCHVVPNREIPIRSLVHGVSVSNIQNYVCIYHRHAHHQFSVLPLMIELAQYKLHRKECRRLIYRERNLVVYSLIWKLAALKGCDINTFTTESNYRFVLHESFWQCKGFNIWLQRFQSKFKNIMKIFVLE